MSASSAQTGSPAPVTATQAGATDPDGNLQPLLVDEDGALITSGGASGGNPSVSPTGDPVPDDATYIAGNSAGDLVGVKVAADGAVAVDVESVSGNVTVVQPTGTNLHTVVDSGSITVTQGTGTNLHAVIDSGDVTVSQGTAANLNATVAQGTAANLNATVVQPNGSNLHVEVDALPAISGTVAATQSGTWTVQPGNTANTTAWLVTQQGSSSATLANVNDTASSTTLLASNAARRGATIFNDSTVSLYVKFGATASTTSFTVLMAAQAYYELPATPSVYTGVIDGIWASDASGAARVTEW